MGCGASHSVRVDGPPMSAIQPFVIVQSTLPSPPPEYELAADYPVQIYPTADERPPAARLSQASLEDAKAGPAELGGPCLEPLHDHPIQFIHNVGKGKKSDWVVTDASAEILRTILSPVVVATVVGTYRYGKSFLMNQLAGRQSGFELGPTIEGKTRGIWLWAFREATGMKRVILFLDSEGLADVKHSSPEYSMQLFTIGLLLSSCLVMNTMGSTINTDDLAKLSFVTKLSDHVKVSADSGSGGALEQHLPSLFWVLRDAFLTMEDSKHNLLTEDQMLERVLRCTGDENETLDRTRKTIRNAFKKRTLRRLPPPANGKGLLDIETKKWLELPSLWRSAMSELRTDFFDFVTTKTLNSAAEGTDAIAITGSELLLLTQTYLKVINDGKTPAIQDAWQSISHRSCESAVNEALKSYTDNMDHYLVPAMPVTREDLLELHNAYAALAVKIFNEVAIGPLSSEYLKKIQVRNSG
ncbi:guanylate-binding protein [Geranomyces variabilis]|nr:guanylate-binding protein [Geranomyces variabilis]